MTRVPLLTDISIDETAFSPLPPIPPDFPGGCGTLLLFYQYREPIWTPAEHKKALKKVIELGTLHNITGRGRVAPEGLNCTLTGDPGSIRSFCTGLREWDALFLETDFKLTDGIPRNKMFKSLSVRKTGELVAYGLPGAKAPSLRQFAGEHLEADQYHQAMSEPDTVIVDVRNAYESAIGNFKPPPGGAELIDPKMRNSDEFPKWLSDKKTREKLKGKKVLMYCTGGIRCERATALLNQMSAADPELKPKGVYELRGGIERYIKTYPEGGFWSGKNYLFDRRMEQLPQGKDEIDIEKEVDSKCCLCRGKCTVYRGKFKCGKSVCRVPVIVCKACEGRGLKEPENLTCELCRVGHKAAEARPDLLGQKRKAESAVMSDKSQSNAAKKATQDSGNDKGITRPPSRKHHNDRLFLARLPLTITLSKLKQLLGEDCIQLVHWLADNSTGAFYGSCVVQFQSAEETQRVLQKGSGTGGGWKIDKKKIKVSPAVVKEEECWPPRDFAQKEFPPIGR